MDRLKWQSKFYLIQNTIKQALAQRNIIQSKNNEEVYTPRSVEFDESCAILADLLLEVLFSQNDDIVGEGRREEQSYDCQCCADPRSRHFLLVRKISLFSGVDGVDDDEPVPRAEMKKTTATQKKSKEVDTATEMQSSKKQGVIPRFEWEEERVHERIDENVQAELSDESLKKVTSVLRKMADTVVEFAEVMAEIGNTRTGGGIIKRTFENIAEMINGVSNSQPPQQQGLLDDDDIFNQPSFLDGVSALEQAFLQTRKNYAAQPERPTTSQSQHHIQTPSFDLGVPSPQPAAMEQPQNKIDSTEL
nr:platelet glycoprotein Ib alpha chain-like [Ipomoea batatas]